MPRREVSVYCPSCGYQNGEGANFCTSCGTDLRGSRESDAPAAEAPTSVIPAVDDADDDETTDDDTLGDAPTDPDATRVVAPASADLRVCPNCDAPNAPARTICGRCGADLDTGRVAKLPAVSYAPADAEDDDTAPRPTQRARADESSGRGSGRRTWLVAAAVVVVGGLLGIVAGMVVALRGGDGADDTAALPDAPAFDRSVYDDEPAQLRVDRIGASSTNVVGGEEQSVARILDGELATAWESDGGENPGGVGEQIAIEFDRAVWIDAMVLGNGNQADDGLFLGGSRIQLVRVRFDGEAVVEVTLNDATGLQVVELPEPVLTTGLQLQVQEVYDGDTYPELGLSELRFTGWPAQGRDAEIASERAAEGG